jgi:hypothetical protein
LYASRNAVRSAPSAAFSKAVRALFTLVFSVVSALALDISLSLAFAYIQSRAKSLSIQKNKHIRPFAANRYINAPPAESMPLHSILESWDKPVKPEVIKEIVHYMKSMPSDQEALVIQCALHLDKSQTLGAVLAVVHALNEGEFLLKCISDDSQLESDLTSEFEKMLSEDKKDASIPYKESSDTKPR